MACTHPKTHIIASSAWTGTEYKTLYHCGKCGCVLKKETTRLKNNTIRTQYVEQEDGIGK